MALQRIETDAIEDDAVTTTKIAPNAIAAADIAADAITNVKVAAGAAIAVAKISGLGTAATLTAGTAANNVVQLDGSARLPAVSGVNLTGITTDTSAMENNIAILAFKTQTANNLAKFNLVDQVVDEYYDTTGIDLPNSTNELTGGSGIAKYIEGGTGATPTVTITGTGNTTVTDGDYKVHTFITNGTLVTDTATTVDYLVVAGGGGGAGGNYGGGGGGGGLRTSFGSTSGGGASAETDASLSAATYTIVVGAGGGRGAAGPTGNGGNGGTSSISGTGVSITTVGGGGGGGALDGSAGGSGGGAGREGGSSNADGGAGTANEGYIGGSSNPAHSGAGGGGASAAGINTSTVATNQGTNGGAGLAVAIRGDHVTTPSVVGDWNGSTGNATYGSGTVTWTGGDKAIYAKSPLTGDFTLLVTPTNVSTGAWIGVRPVAEEETWNSAHENGNMQYMTHSYFYAGVSRSSQTAGFMKGGNNSLQAYSSSNNDVVKIQRVGSTLTNYLNGTLKHTATGVWTGDMRVVLGGGGAGGGYSNYTNISWTEPAEIFAGGGGGASWSGSAWHQSGQGGNGGGSPGVPGSGRNIDGGPNTGGGGGSTSASDVGGYGGTGIVVIRRETSTTALGGNLTLQSIANTALSAPTTGDICMLIENGAGTATLNTDIKAYVSRNGGTGWDQATLVDKGTWGSGTKKIVTANNVAFSNSASGVDMRYKITTHNQSAGSKETRIHATSLAWA